MKKKVDKKKLVRLEEAVDFVPIPVSLATVRQWVKRGIGGKKLEVTKIGGRLYTTQEKLEQFLDYCNQTYKVTQTN